MNPILQLRWMIAMLEHQRAVPGQQTSSADTFNESAKVLQDMRTELRVLEKLRDETIAQLKDGPRYASQKDKA